MMLKRMAVAAAATILFGCGGSDDDGGPTGPNQQSGSFTASIGGTSFTANATVAAAFTGTALSLTAADGSGKAFAFGVGMTTTGVYDLGDGGNFGSYAETSGGTTQSWLTNVVQGTGQMIITQLTTSRVVGSFTMNAPGVSGAPGTKMISGAFDVTFGTTQ